MKSKLVAILALGAAYAGGAFAQTEPAAEFEAVSIKPAPPPTGMGIRVMMRGGPGSDDPGRLDWNNVALREMITQAFNIKNYQVQGPDWLGNQRFDLVAKVPMGTTREQYRLMIQKMLADRFGLKFHKETKDHAAYALVVAKGGPKLKESDPNDTSGFAPMTMRGPDGVERRMAVPPPPPPPGGVGATRGLDAGPGGRGGPPAGRGGMMMSMPGHFQAKKMGIEGLANMLANLTGKPVVDETGLKGSYDFTLDYAPETAEGFIAAPPPPGGGDGRGPAPSESTGLSIYAAIQQELGLRLEAKKVPLENVIIDHIEKLPIEN